MAIRFLHRARPVLVLAAIASAAVIAPTIAAASPGAPRQEPTIDSVQKQLGALAIQNSQVVEKYNYARVVVGRREKGAGAARTQAAAASAAYRRANMAFAQNVQAQYEAGSMGAAGALLDSESGPNYVDRLNTLNMLAIHDGDVVARVTEARSAAAAQDTKARHMLAAATQERDGLAAKQDAVKKQIQKYKDLLSTLNSVQLAAYQRGSNAAIPDVSTLRSTLPKARSKGAQAAVRFSLAQVGKPYVFGAAGPGAFDCSGLTMKAWQAGGVSLPHSAADQLNYGHRVDRLALQPGDLVFLYQPIGHVEIYIGDGLMVSAPTEGQNVQVVRFSDYESDFAGATRLG